MPSGKKRERSRAVDAPLPNRAAFHPARKIFHFLTGVCFALLNENFTWGTSVILTTSLFLIVLLTEVFRLQSPEGHVNQIVIQLFKPFMRAHETRAFAGMLYYVGGVALTIICFPHSRSSATLGILALASLDPAAAFFGSWLTPSIPSLRLSHGKSIAGLVGAAVTGALVLYTVISHADGPMSTVNNSNDAWMIAVLVAWVGALTEFSIPSPQIIIGTKMFPFGIDDNAIIPVVCAFAARLVLRATHHRLELSPNLI